MNRYLKADALLQAETEQLLRGGAVFVMVGLVGSGYEQFADELRSTAANLGLALSFEDTISGSWARLGEPLPPGPALLLAGTDHTAFAHLADQLARAAGPDRSAVAVTFRWDPATRSPRAHAVIDTIKGLAE